MREWDYLRGFSKQLKINHENGGKSNEKFNEKRHSLMLKAVIVVLLAYLSRMKKQNTIAIKEIRFYLDTNTLTHGIPLQQLTPLV